LESNQYAFLVIFDSGPGARESRTAGLVTTALLPTAKNKDGGKITC
jgi:hypothetical protein